MEVIQPTEPAAAERLGEAPAPAVAGLGLVILTFSTALQTLTGPAAAGLALVGVALTAWRFGAGGGLVAALVTGAPVLVIGGPAAAAIIGIAGMLLAGFVAMLRDAYAAERDAARIDRLTGALNRWGFEAKLATAAAEAAQTGHSYLLAYADLDGFKAVNDGFGHAAGDAVLRGFADAARAALQPGDLLGRIGGDEFVMLLRPVDGLDPYSQAEAVHDRLATALAAYGYPMLGCSMGTVIVDPPPHPSRDTLLGWADALMYEVKQAGKGAMRIAHASLQAG